MLIPNFKPGAQVKCVKKTDGLKLNEVYTIKHNTVRGSDIYLTLVNHEGLHCSSKFHSTIIDLTPQINKLQSIQP